MNLENEAFLQEHQGTIVTVYERWKTFKGIVKGPITMQLVKKRGYCYDIHFKITRIMTNILSFHNKFLGLLCNFQDIFIYDIHSDNIT